MQDHVSICAKRERTIPGKELDSERDLLPRVHRVPDERRDEFGDRYGKGSEKRFPVGVRKRSVRLELSGKSGDDVCGQGLRLPDEAVFFVSVKQGIRRKKIVFLPVREEILAFRKAPRTSRYMCLGRGFEGHGTEDQYGAGGRLFLTGHGIFSQRGRGGKDCRKVRTVRYMCQISGTAANAVPANRALFRVSYLSRSAQESTVSSGMKWRAFMVSTSS